MAHSMRTSVKGRAARDWRSADDTAVDGENRWHRSENREAGRQHRNRAQALRPLPDDGTERLEIADGTRSMSKRHATFAVSQNGGGTVRDLGSTNGSYVVRGNGDLMRLPPNVDFLLPTSPMRLQFGDVPVDFIRVEQPVSDTFVVPDLFGYALETVKQEPDVADMSVDDILDLRAGEPTAAISAATVRKRVGELNAAASQAFPPQKTTTADGLAADSAAGAAEPDPELAVSSDAAMPVEAAVLAETVSPAEADAAESDAETKVRKPPSPPRMRRLRMP